MIKVNVISFPRVVGCFRPLPLRVIGCHLWQKSAMNYGVRHSLLKVTSAAGLYIYSVIVTVAFW